MMNQWILRKKLMANKMREGLKNIEEIDIHDFVEESQV